MKKRKIRLYQKFITFCLTAALAAGLVLGNAPIKVNAAESTVSSFTDLKNAIENASGDLTVMVAADIGMTEIISVPEGSTVTVISDGNYTLKRQSGFEDAMFDVSGTLKLGSSDGMAGNNLTLDGGAVWTGTVNAVLGRGQTNSGLSADDSLLAGNAGSSIYLYSGVMLQNNRCSINGSGGAVTLREKAKLYLSGAVLRYCFSNDGGGAVKTYIGSRIAMDGGEVYGNQAGTHGGAFQIYGCQKGNTLSHEEASCLISGGTIRNNLCSRVGGAIAVSNYSKLELSGNAVIRDNMTTSYTHAGGGIGFADADTSLNISGSTVIEGNKQGSADNNLHIGSNSNNKITVESLSDNARIGITMSGSLGAFSNALDQDYSAGFFSDNDTYTVASQEGNVLALVKKDHVHSPGSEWKSNETSHWHECACGNRTEEASHTEDSGTEVKAPTETAAVPEEKQAAAIRYPIRLTAVIQGKSVKR